MRKYLFLILIILILSFSNCFAAQYTHNDDLASIFSGTQYESTYEFYIDKLYNAYLENLSDRFPYYFITFSNSSSSDTIYLFCRTDGFYGAFYNNSLIVYSNGSGSTQMNYGVKTTSNGNDVKVFDGSATAMALITDYSTTQVDLLYNNATIMDKVGSTVYFDAKPIFSPIDSTLNMSNTVFPYKEDVILTITDNNQNADLMFTLNGEIFNIDRDYIGPNWWSNYYDSSNNCWNIKLNEITDLDIGDYTINLNQIIEDTSTLVDSISFSVVANPKFGYIGNLKEPYSFYDTPIGYFFLNGLEYIPIIKLQQIQNDTVIIESNLHDVVDLQNGMLSIYSDTLTFKASIEYTYRLIAINEDGEEIAASDEFYYYPTWFIAGETDDPSNPTPGDIEYKPIINPDTGEVDGYVTEDITREEQTNSINQTIEDAKNGIIGGILDGIKGLFIPDSEFFSNYWNDLSGFMQSKLGFLWDVLSFIPEFFNNIITVCKGIDEGSLVFKIPTLSLPLNGEEYVLLESFEYDIDKEFLSIHDEFSNLYEIYLNLIDFLVFMALVGYALSIIEDIFNVNVTVHDDKPQIGFKE